MTYFDLLPLKYPMRILQILLPVISLLCRLTAWVQMARWHGTRCWGIYVILFALYLVLKDYLRHFFFSDY